MDTDYTYWCSEEKDWIFEWTQSIPTQCKNNVSHTISNISINRELLPNGREVIIHEQKYNNNGKGSDFCTESIIVNVTSSNLTEKIISFPMNVNLFELTLYPYSVSSEEDIIDVLLNPQYTCGVLTTNSTSGDTEFYVSETVLKYIRKPGWFVVTLVNGGDTEEIGRVIAIDRVNGKITMENPTTINFPSGSLIKVDFYMMRQFEIFTNNSGIPIGQSKIGGTFIPKNVPILVKYYNNNNIPKKFMTKLEYTW